MKTLVIAAHPDDEVLGSGGTIARRSSEGESVDVLILGEGVTSRAPSRSEALQSEVALLREASVRACSLMGAQNVIHHNFPDNRFDEVSLLDIVKAIEAVIDETAPDRVLCQHGGDANIDHRRTFEAVIAATRPQPGYHVRAVYTFEVASSTEWAFHALSPRFRPTLFVDISDHLEVKLRAMEEYASELREPPHPRSLDRIEMHARQVGATVGLDAAEAYYVVRDIQ